MTPLPDNLSEDDLVLLHLAGELPDAQQSATAAHRVATDLDAGEFALLFGDLDHRLKADAASAVLPPVGPAVQQFVGVIRAAAPLPIAAVRRTTWRPPAWSIYPAAAAALVAIVMGGWWFKVRDKLEDPRTVAIVQPGFTTVFRGEADRDLSELNDDQISMQFDTMVFEPRIGLEQPLAELQYLESQTQ